MEKIVCFNGLQAYMYGFDDIFHDLCRMSSAFIGKVPVTKKPFKRSRCVNPDVFFSLSHFDICMYYISSHVPQLIVFIMQINSWCIAKQISISIELQW